MAYALAQNPAAANGSGANSISKAFASTVTAHSLLVAFITTDAATPGTFTVTGGGTWATIAAIKEPVTTQWLCIGYCLDATGGTAPTVQASWTGNGTFNGLLIAEFTNGGVASLFDTNTAGSTGSSTAPTDSAMTAAGADAVVSYAIGSSASPTVGATFTYGTNQDTTDLAAWEYKVLAGAGPVTPVFAITPSQAWGIISAAFKPASVAAVPTGSAWPGRTWWRQFKHRQAAATPPVAAAATAAPTVGPLVASPGFAWPAIPAATITWSQPLGNPAVGSPQPLVVSTPWAPRLGTALLFGPGTATSTVQPLVVSPPSAWPVIPPVTITWSPPPGNPATGSPQPLVVSAAWTAQATRPQLFGPGAPAAVVTSAPTPGPLTVGPPFAWPAPPPVTIVTSQPLGNPAVGTGSPLIVSTPAAAKVPGALLFGPGASPPPVSTVATSGPLVVTPPFTPVPIPKQTITWSAPLGNPAVATPQPLVVGPRHAVPPVPGAGLFAAPSAPTVPAVSTPGPLIVGPPWQPVPIPRTYLTWSQPLGRPAVGSPQPLIVGPPFRWPVWTASLLSGTPTPALAFTPVLVGVDGSTGIGGALDGSGAGAGLDGSTAYGGTLDGSTAGAGLDGSSAPGGQLE